MGLVSSGLARGFFWLARNARTNAEKPAFAQAAQEGPDVPRLRGTASPILADGYPAWCEAHLARTCQRRARVWGTRPEDGSRQMGLFQQPARRREVPRRMTDV